MIQTPAKPKKQTDPRKALWIWAVALGILSYQVAFGRLTFVDRQMASWVAALHSPFLDRVMQALTFFGSSTWTTVALIGLGFLAFRHGGIASVLILLGSFLVAAVMEVGLRLSIAQWRPDTIVVPASMDVMTRFELAGFPSGHGFRSAFVFGWFAQQLKDARWAQAGKVGCVVLIGLVGISRLYLNRHWATDVLGSWLVVLVALSIARCWEHGACKHAFAVREKLSSLKAS